MTVREERRDLIFDLLVANPDGVTVDDMIAEIETVWYLTPGSLINAANEAIRDLRRFLGESDDINLVCDPAGQGQRWNYSLVGTLAQATPWLVNRFKDNESRLFTIESVARSMVTATKGNTRDGRKARVTERALRRLREDLQDIDLNGGP